MYGYIYKTINNITGDVYIGKHTANQFEPECYIGSGTYIKWALKRFGREAFRCKMLCECENKDILTIMEQYYIFINHMIYKEKCVNVDFNVNALLKPIIYKDLDHEEYYENKLEYMIKSLPDAYEYECKIFQDVPCSPYHTYKNIFEFLNDETNGCSKTKYYTFKSLYNESERFFTDVLKGLFSDPDSHVLYDNKKFCASLRYSKINDYKFKVWRSPDYEAFCKCIGLDTHDYENIKKYYEYKFPNGIEQAA